MVRPTTSRTTRRKKVWKAFLSFVVCVVLADQVEFIWPILDVVQPELVCPQP